MFSLIHTKSWFDFCLHPWKPHTINVTWHDKPTETENKISTPHQARHLLANWKSFPSNTTIRHLLAQLGTFSWSRRALSTQLELLPQHDVAVPHVGCWCLHYWSTISSSIFKLLSINGTIHLTFTFSGFPRSLNEISIIDCQKYVIECHNCHISHNVNVGKGIIIMVGVGTYLVTYCSNSQ